MNRIIQAVSKNNTHEWTMRKLIDYLNKDYVKAKHCITPNKNEDFFLQGYFSVVELEALLIAWENGR